MEAASRSLAALQPLAFPSYASHAIAPSLRKSLLMMRALPFAGSPCAAHRWIAGPTSTTLRRIWPGEDGHYVAEGLRPGTYRVIAVERTPRSFLQCSPAVLASLATRAMTLTVADQTTVDVKLSSDQKQH